MSGGGGGGEGDPGIHIGGAGGLEMGPMGADILQRGDQKNHCIPASRLVLKKTQNAARPSQSSSHAPQKAPVGLLKG